MEEKIPNLPMKKECKHKKSFPLYAREEKKWTSTQQVLGYMVHMCLDCGAFLQVKKQEVKKHE